MTNNVIENKKYVVAERYFLASRWEEDDGYSDANLVEKKIHGPFDTLAEAIRFEDQIGDSVFGDDDVEFVIKNGLECVPETCIMFEGSEKEYCTGVTLEDISLQEAKEKGSAIIEIFNKALKEVDNEGY